MYGKIFASLFTGSMRGKGDLQLVFTYMISTCSEDGICDFTPQCIADATGKPLPLIETCISELEDVDEMSRTTTDDGRRIIKIDSKRPWGWRIVNYALYRGIATREAMKEAERLRKREYREFKKTQCPGLVPDKTGHSAYASSDLNSSLKGDARGSLNSDFDQFWLAYPKHQAKSAAMKAWIKSTSRPTLDCILRAIELQKDSDQWKKEGGQFIPMPATWINQERWTDETQITVKPLIRSRFT